MSITFRLICSLCVLSSVVLSSCASLSKSECQTADWESVGYNDGSRGFESGRIQSHRDACIEHGMTPDATQYEAGRLRGLAQYCTTSNGLRAGKQGYGYNGVCPDEFADGFLNGYEHGRRMHEVASRMNSLREDINRTHTRLRNSDDLNERERDYLIYRLRDLERDYGRLESEYRELDFASRRL
jgi:hypothetical protein